MTYSNCLDNFQLDPSFRVQSLYVETQSTSISQASCPISFLQSSTLFDLHYKAGQWLLIPTVRDLLIFPGYTRMTIMFMRVSENKHFLIFPKARQSLLGILCKQTLGDISFHFKNWFLIPASGCCFEAHSEGKVWRRERWDGRKQSLSLKDRAYLTIYHPNQRTHQRGQKMVQLSNWY